MHEKNLEKILPNTMPENQEIKTGQQVLVRFKNQKELYNGEIKVIWVGKNKVEGTDLSRADKISLIVTINDLGDNPVYLPKDKIFTYSWIEGWLGKDIQKQDNKTKETKRLDSLLG